jgi:FkbM family methyltransferase
VELFENEIYRFNSSNKTPLILDCGTNIGLSVIYFKRLHPDSRIIAFEPDPNIFNVLQGNVESFKDVELINKAVWTSETTLEFMAEGSAGGRLVSIEQNAKKYQVSTVRLRDYLKEPIDMLKITHLLMVSKN